MGWNGCGCGCGDLTMVARDGGGGRGNHGAGGRACVMLVFCQPGATAYGAAWLWLAGRTAVCSEAAPQSSAGMYPCVINMRPKSLAGLIRTQWAFTANTWAPAEVMRPRAHHAGDAEGGPIA